VASFFREQTVPIPERTPEEYLSELSRELRRRLPDAETAEIVAEAESHLQERIDDSVASGVTKSEAVWEALVDFGTPALFARRTADGMTDSRVASISRRGLQVLAGMMFALAASFAMRNSYSPFLLLMLYQVDTLSPELRNLVFVIVIVVFAFLGLAFSGGRTNTRYLLGCGAVVLALSCIGTGMHKAMLPSGQWADRRQLQNNLKHERCSLAELREEEHLLRLGIVAYSAASPQAITGTLKQVNRYIVPIATKITIQGTAHDLTYGSAFRPIARYTGQGNSFNIWYRPEKFDTVLSYKEARARWEKFSPRWLQKTIIHRRDAQERLRQYEWLAQQPQQFRLDLMGTDDLWSLPFTTVLLLMDGAAASMGRRFLLIRRRRRRKQAV
jgi:hypothetical protein